MGASAKRAQAVEAATLAAKPRSHQANKSAATRKRLIDAAIKCIVKHGYADTTTLQVANEAGLSRGAMLHHFENGRELIKATVAELHERRLNAFRRAAERNAENSRGMVRDYWRQLQKPGFVAFQELAMAARTNAELAEILHPMQVEFRERLHELAVQLFPEWQSRPEQFELAMALAQTLTEGAATALLTGALEPKMVEPLLDELEHRIVALRPGAKNDNV